MSDVSILGGKELKISFTLQLDGQLGILKSLATTQSKKIKTEEFDSFKEWIERCEENTCPDEGRYLAYHIFQPLFDVLILSQLNRFKEEDFLGKSSRKEIFSVFKQVEKEITKYYASYYLGKPDLTILSNLCAEIKPVLVNLPYYYHKHRNIDRNGISPQNINLFITTFIEKVLSGEISTPDLIIGCACGSAEIVMALAGILNIKCDFIRKSGRRGDDKAIIIKEQEIEIKNLSKDNIVYVVEDYLCTGKSLAAVMSEVKKYGANKVIGCAINNHMESYDGSYVATEIQSEKFSILKFINYSNHD